MPKGRSMQSSGRRARKKAAADEVAAQAELDRRWAMFVLARPSPSRDVTEHQKRYYLVSQVLYESAMGVPAGPVEYVWLCTVDDEREVQVALRHGRGRVVRTRKGQPPTEEKLNNVNRLAEFVVQRVRAASYLVEVLTRIEALAAQLPKGRSHA